MLSRLRRDLASSIVAVVALTVLLGVAYPLLVTGLSALAMPDRAGGSLVERDGTVVGSRLLAQDGRRPVLNAGGTPKEDADGSPVLEPEPRLFQSRPSATGYAANATAFANLGPNGADTREATKAHLDAYLALERPYDRSLTVADVPADAVQTSASGLDPHVSRRNAEIQAHRIAATRRLPYRRVLALIDAATDGRALGVLGEPGVNVLTLNLALDREAPSTRPAPAR
ncbi:potassium-transporting ATPase subunit C [Patulibacter sp. S7RM1-6]